MTSHASVVVLGAGPTGLSAAYHLGARALLLDREASVGGLCRSIEADGFTFDMAGHIMFSNDPYVHHLYRMLLGSNVHWQEREAWVYSKGVHTRYPFQGSLHGLPPEVIEECLVGAIDARHGDWRRALEASRSNGHSHGRSNGHANGHAPSCGPHPDDAPLRDCCADGILEADLPRESLGNGDEPRDFEEFIYRVWGAGIAKHFAIPYNRKLWTVPLSEMETSWLQGRVPLPDLASIVRGALHPSPRPMGPNARFGYPKRGGFQALMDGFLPHLQGEVRLRSEVVAISPTRRSLTLRNGAEIRYDALVSTMPLPELIRRIVPEAPPSVRRAARGLKHVSCRCVNLGVGRAGLTEKHWTYYPEDTVFHRIFFQGNASPECNPPGGFGLTCEITHSPAKPLPCDGDDLIRRCIDDCRRVGVLQDGDPILTANQVDIPYAYVVYDHGRTERVRLIRTWLADHAILLAGRYSEWEYYNSDHAFLAGKKAAEAVASLLGETDPASEPPVANRPGTEARSASA
ncbi:MAG: NAD(P)/FAD-dependent oxidoreductase [Gemmatimonadales bacterium]